MDGGTTPLDTIFLVFPLIRHHLYLLISIMFEALQYPERMQGVSELSIFAMLHDGEDIDTSCFF